MKNFNLLRKSDRKSVGTTLALTVGSPSFDRRYSALKHLTFMLLFLLGSLNVWGGDASVGDVLWGEDFGHYAANDVPSTKGTGTGTTVYGGATITYSNGSNVKAYSGNGQTYAGGSGAELYIKKGSSWTISGIPTGGATEMTLTYKSNNTNSSVATTDSPLGISISGSSKNYTITNTNGANSLTLVFSAASGNTRLDDIQLVVKTAAAGGCDKKVNISKGTPANGDFTLSMSGAQATCDGDVQVVVTPTPEEHYKVTGVSAPNSSNISGPDGDGTYTVTYTQNTNADSEISVTFALKDKYTVTWNNHGLTSTSQVYEGEKPVFPETPTSCDATSTTFIGWATENWTGKLADLAGKTVYTSAAEMPAVTGPVEYFAVFAKVAGESGWIETAIGDLGASDVFVIVGNNGSTYAMTNDNKASSAPGASSVTIADSKITSDVAGNIKWNISGNATDGYTFYPNGDSESWLYCTNTNNGVRVGTNTNKTFAISGGYLKHSGTSRYVGIYNSQDWRCYTGTDGNIKNQTFKFYKYSAGSASDYMTTCAAEGTCEAPSFSPVAGTFDAAQDITLQTSTPSAHIYYTLDGTDPDDGSAEYSTPIHITQNTTIKAITYADGLTKSSISEGVFNIRCAQPTFSPVGGKYDVAKNVTISADGAAIYYAIGETPTIDEEHKYTAPIAINTTGSHTINAIAVKEGYANSNVASATYVMDLPYGSIAEFVTAKPNTAKDLVFEEADNCVITGINGTTIYIQDASGKGIMIFGLSSLPTNAAVNHQITGTINAKYTSFKGQHEMTNVDFSGASISEDPVSRPTPAAVTAIDATKFNEHTMVLVSIENLYYKSSSDKTHKFATTEGGSTEYTIYDQFGIMSGKTMPETSVACNLTGILSVYNTTYQLLPVFATDIVADADAAAPVFTPAGGADAENAVTAAAVEITAAAGTKVDGLASKTVDINSVIPTEVTVEVTRDFYRSVNYSCGWYKAAAAKYNINGQGETTEGTVVAKVAGVEAATAAEGDEVHVFITPNAHFHLATILVNDAAPAEVVEGAEYSFTMPGEAVTIAVTWTEDAKATLTFAKGDADGEEAAPENIVDYIGETVQLPANPFTYTGHKFVGWSCDGGTTKLAAGANYVLAEDKAFVAQWDEIPTFNNSGYEWQLVTSDAQLVAGKYYVIASTAKGKVMSNTITSNVAGEIAATFTDGVIAYNAFGSSQSADAAGVAVLQLGGEADAWKLTEVVANDALLGATAEKKLAWGSGTTTWSISIASANANATIQNGTSSYGRFLHNVNSNRFTTYTSKTSAAMLLPQLYVWSEKVYKLRYDANGGENAPASQPAVAGEATVTDAKPTYTDHIFNGWNTLVGGNGEAKAAGDVIDLSAGDVTLYAQWREPNTYSISYDANGGTLIEGESEITPTSVTEGNAYTIEENVYEVEGKLFIGWKANGVTYNAGQEIYPTENMTFVAQWGDPNVTDFMLVTDVKQLKDGDKVYIVAADYNVAMGTQNDGNYRNYVEIAKQNNRVVILNATPVEFTVGKDGDNFTFNDGTGYLYASSSEKNYLNTEVDLDNNGKWAITINTNGVASIIAQGTNTNNNLKWNNSSPRFSCYKSGQKAVSIYKRPDYTRNVSGNYATICLPKAGKIEGATLYEIAYYGGASKKIFFDEIVNGEMEAGIPYIFQPAAGVEKINVYYSDNTAEDVVAGNRNGLIGFYDLTKPTATHNIDQDAGFYILYNNQYWLVSGREAYVENYRAYIQLNQITPSEPTLAPGRRRISMSVNDTQTTTGFENAEANEAPRKVLINGELFILRGEKMYDAKGQLVK